MSDTIDQINSVIVNITNTRNQLNYMKKILAVAPENEEILSETQSELKRIRKFYDTSSTAGSFFPFGTEYVYVWELEEGKYYVGYSENLSGRLEQHTTGDGALWTKKYKPVSILEIVRGGKDVEKVKTLEYIKLKGFENVRGAGWCKLEYSSIPQGVQEYLSGHQKKELQGTLLSNLAE
jgi:predicted GIY-YIG superfamily endonuclease